MAINSLEELYVDHLRDLYSAENQILKALPQISKKSNASELKSAFDFHLKQTENHVVRLEKVFQKLDKKPTGKKCVGMEGLLKEGEEIMKEKLDPVVMDAGLIGAAQKVEHYEISAYGTARAYARLLGDNEAVDIFTQTLNEESAADEKLTKIAEQSINVAAMQR